MGLLSVSTALAVAAAAPAAKAPPLPVLAAVSVIKLAVDPATIVADVAPHLDPIVARTRLRQPLIAFQAPARFIALTRPAAFTAAPVAKANDVVRPATRQSTYIPRTLLIGSDYIGSRPHERGIGRLGSKIVLRMTTEGTRLGVNGGVAGALMRLVALSD